MYILRMNTRRNVVKLLSVRQWSTIPYFKEKKEKLMQMIFRSIYLLEGNSLREIKDQRNLSLRCWINAAGLKNYKQTVTCVQQTPVFEYSLFLEYLCLQCLEDGVDNHVHVVTRGVYLVGQVKAVVVVVVVLAAAPCCPGDVDGHSCGKLRVLVVPRSCCCSCCRVVHDVTVGIVAAQADPGVILKVQLVRKGSHVLEGVLDVVQGGDQLQERAGKSCIKNSSRNLCWLLLDCKYIFSSKLHGVMGKPWLIWAKIPCSKTLQRIP